MTSLSKLFGEPHFASSQTLSNELPLLGRDDDREAGSENEKKTGASSITESQLPPVSATVIPSVSVPESSAVVNVDFYTLFLARFLELTSAGPMAVDDIAARLELEKTQVNAWLKRAQCEEKISKLTRPVRYQINPEGKNQTALFEK